MAKQTSSATIPQAYPRIQDSAHPHHGCLDDSQLVEHQQHLEVAELRALIEQAIHHASRKSSREIISAPPDATEEQLALLYQREGRALFQYFRKYCGDPAATAHQLHRKHYRAVGLEQFRNKTLQRERMNSGWRYQFLAVDCAGRTRRFKRVSDLAAAEGDFTAVIDFVTPEHKPLSLYVSVKNRVNTMGGQDWPKAIQALESAAKNDKNRTGPYCCVFGIAMDRGTRKIKRSQKTGVAHSVNTEVWLSDFFWPFFTNYSFEEIMTHVLEVLIALDQKPLTHAPLEVPEVLLESFGDACRREGLIDETGCFNDPFKLVKFFCRPVARKKEK